MDVAEKSKGTKQEMERFLPVIPHLFYEFETKTLDSESGNQILKNCQISLVSCW